MRPIAIPFTLTSALARMPKTLYICYFGIREALVQTQVLPYLRELIKGEYSGGKLQVSILTFEPDTSLDATPIRKQLIAEGIHWYWLPYHKRFSAIATAWDVIRGTMFVRRFISREHPDILHGRVHVPTLMGALGRELGRHKPKLLFDIRGFFPEEYTDAGVWPENGILYKTAKRVERWLLKESDGFVVLTEKAREILFPESRETGFDKQGRPVEVIPCCVDMARFAAGNGDARARMRKELGVDGRRVIAYVGSFGGWYLTEQMLDFFAAAREYDPKSFVMILTQRDREKVIEKLNARGFADSDFFVGSVSPGELPLYLSAADSALSFIKACYSKQSSSPTKIAEYLACGLPIVANSGVGDIDTLIASNLVGSLINDFSRQSYASALDQVEGVDAKICRQVAAREFDLARVGGEKYRDLYRRVGRF